MAGFFLNLDGAAGGWLHDVSGGDAFADVIVEAQPGDFPNKRIGPPQYEEISLSFGFSLEKPLYNWITAAWNMKDAPKDGSVITTDLQFQPRSERQFFDALLTETTIPACNGSSKDPAYMTVKIAPGRTRNSPAKGKLKAPPVASKQFTAQNFRAEIGGLDCSKVSRVESFTVKFIEPTKIEFPDLAITLSEAAAASWSAWHEDFVINGNNDRSAERSGALVFLAPNRVTELGRVTLENLGIFALHHHPAARDQLASVTAELYCGRMELAVG